MIGDILTITPTIAGDIPQFSIVQIWDEGLSASRLVMCKVQTANWSVFAYDNGYTFRMLNSEMISVVTNVESWDTMSNDTRMDIELDLMVRGA
jgi:hypothetical protein